MKPLPKKARVDRILKAVVAAGNDAEDLRDAAHEACHALQIEQPFGYWSREALHKRLLGLPSLARGYVEVVFANGRVSECIKYKQRRRTRQEALIAYEIEARAVEQIVCKDLGVKTEPVEHWAAITIMEAKIGVEIQLPDLAVVAARIEEMRKTKIARDLADGVIALGAPR